MENFQLYRTNLFLGGQMKWDLIINGSNTHLSITDFHLSPISNNIPYTYKTDENLLNNSHTDNVKNFYAENKGYFYNEGLNSEFSHNWPILYDDNLNVDLYSNIYDMGCKRTKSYNKYNKQFEFLCPVWIEKLTESDTISFKLNIKNIKSDEYQEDIIFSSNTLSFIKNSNDYHNKFVDYFKQYISESKLDIGCDDVLNVSFDNNTASLTGLNVSNGLFETKILYSLTNDLSSRERPLIENDNLLIQSFVNNTCICKQLFNFNICFNIEDIFSSSVTNLIKGKSFIISVDVLINGVPLEKRDFYTNYEFIQKPIINKNTNTDGLYNVLDYLHDYECINLIPKNKFNQPICHWSLCENNDYIFNTYDGFSGLYIENDESNNQYIYENQHQYGNTSDINIKLNDKSKNSTSWFNNINLSSWNSFYKYIKNTNKYKTDGTYIFDKQYVNNLKYNYIPKINNGFYLLGITVTDKLLTLITNNFNCITLYNNIVYMLCIDDLVLIITNNTNYISFGAFYDILNKLKEQNFDGYDEKMIIYIKELYNMLSSLVKPTIITFNNSLIYSTAPSPSTNSKEIVYYKENNKFNYVIRYDGKLKPSFINHSNILYYKDCVNKNNYKNTKYFNYTSDKIEPLYPSIDYCAIKSIKNYSYDKLPDLSLYNQQHEYSWFNENKCIILSPKISFEYNYTNDENINDIIYKLVSEYYNITDKDKIKYIINMYDICNNWEYKSLTNISEYVYNITLTLK